MISAPVVAARNILRRMTGRILHSPKAPFESESLGSEYGGHTIRRGQLGPSSIVYSFGIGTDVSFDLAVIERYGCTVHGFDPTPRSVEWVRENVALEKFVFHELGIAKHDGLVPFKPPKQESHSSFSRGGEGLPDQPKLRVARLPTIMRELGHTHLDLLKLDIEGFEYEVIDDLASSKVRPHAIAVEFHHRMYGYGTEDTNLAVDRLERAGYVLFHVSQTGREYSFWNSSI